MGDGRRVQGSSSCRTDLDAPCPISSVAGGSVLLDDAVGMRPRAWSSNLFDAAHARTALCIDAVDWPAERRPRLDPLVNYFRAA
jgi:hypothetical protein